MNDVIVVLQAVLTFGAAAYALGIVWGWITVGIEDPGAGFGFRLLLSVLWPVLAIYKIDEK